MLARDGGYVSNKKPDLDFMFLNIQEEHLSKSLFSSDQLDKYN